MNYYYYIYNIDLYLYFILHVISRDELYSINVRRNPTPANANPLNVIWKPSGKAGQLLDMGDNFQMIKRKQAINERSLITENYLYFSMPITSDCNDISYANYFSLF